MNQNKTINTYIQLFDSRVTKDAAFYKALYVTPIIESALLSTLRANSESSTSFTRVSAPDIKVFQDIFLYGLQYLTDAIGYTDSSAEDEPLKNLVASYITSIDNGGEDITALNGGRRRLSAAVDLDEGDDITSLNGRTPSRTSRRDSSQSVLSSTSKSARSLSFPLGTSEFEGLDEELRHELIINIAKILQVWFHNITESSKSNYKLYKSLKSSSSYHYYDQDLLFCLFLLPGTEDGLNDSYLQYLLVKVQWFFNKVLTEVESTIKEIDGAYEQSHKLLVIKELIFLVYEILHSLFQSIFISDKFKSTGNDIVIIKSLLLTFYKIDFGSLLDRLLSITSNKHVQDQENYILPKIRLSLESLMKIYTIIASLSNVPTDYLLVNQQSISSDITTILSESPNIYELLFTETKKYPSIQQVNEDVNLRFIPILSIYFNYYHELKPDLLIYQIKNSSFMNWITGNRFNDNLYLTYNPTVNTTNLTTNSKNISFSENDPFLQEILKLYDSKKFILNSGEVDQDDQILVYSPEFLPINLILFTFTRNKDFLNLFTKQSNVVTHKIEDHSSNEDTSIELLEVWLCVHSYLYQYQYKSLFNKFVCKISLLVLLKITSPKCIIKLEEPVDVVDNLLHFQINEFKWKLSHHRLPLIPNNMGNNGYKSSLLYIIDMIQILLRFNLTKKLNVDNFKAGVTVIYQILYKFKSLSADYDKEVLTSLGSYSWNEFYKTLINVLKFIRKQINYQSAINSLAIQSLIEEIYLVFEILLSSQFNTVIQITNDFEEVGKHIIKSINYELVYEILLNYELVHDFYEKLFKTKQVFPNLSKCFSYLQEQFPLENKEEVEGEGEVSQKSAEHIDHFDPKLIEKITNFTFNSEESSNEVDELDENNEYNFRDTLRYFNKSYDNYNLRSNSELFELYSILYDIKW